MPRAVPKRSHAARVLLSPRPPRHPGPSAVPPRRRLFYATYPRPSLTQHPPDPSRSSCSVPRVSCFVLSSALLLPSFLSSLGLFLRALPNPASPRSSFLYPSARPLSAKTSLQSATLFSLAQPSSFESSSASTAAATSRSSYSSLDDDVDVARRTLPVFLLRGDIQPRQRDPSQFAQ